MLYMGIVSGSPSFFKVFFSGWFFQLGPFVRGFFFQIFFFHTLYYMLYSFILRRSCSSRGMGFSAPSASQCTRRCSCIISVYNFAHVFRWLCLERDGQAFGRRVWYPGHRYRKLPFFHVFPTALNYPGINLFGFFFAALSSVTLCIAASHVDFNSLSVCLYL